GILRLVAPSPRRGVLALFDQPTFDRSSLPPLPADLTGFTVASVDPARTYDRVVDLLKAADPAAAGRVAASEEALRQALGADLRKDLLAHLGPHWAVYGQPAGRPAAGGVFTLLDLTVTVQVDDATAVGKALDPLLTALNRRL